MSEEVQLFVRIRRNADGVQRVYKTSDTQEAIDGGCFIWSDGNYACDCNRGRFFAESVGEEDPDECCGDIRYSVRIFDADGKEVYQDGDWPEK